MPSEQLCYAYRVSIAPSFLVALMTTLWIYQPTNYSTCHRVTFACSPFDLPSHPHLSTFLPTSPPSHASIPLLPNPHLAHSSAGFVSRPTLQTVLCRGCNRPRIKPSPRARSNAQRRHLRSTWPIVIPSPRNCCTKLLWFFLLG